MFLACGVGRVRGRHVPRHDARVLQGLPLPRVRLGDPRARRASRTSARWAASPSKIPTTYRTFLVATLAIAGVPLLAGSSRRTRSWRPSSTPSSRRCPWLPKVLWAVGAPHGGPDGLLHVPPARADLLGHVPRDARAGGAHPRVAALDDRAADRPRVPLGRRRATSASRSSQGGNQIGEFLRRSSCRSTGCPRRRTTRRSSVELALMGASVAVAAVGIFLALVLVREGRGARPGAPRGASCRASTGRSRTSTTWTRPTRRSSCEGLAKGGGRLLWDFDATVVDLIPNGAARSRWASPGSPRSSTSTSWTASSTASRTPSRPPSGVFRRAQTGRVQNYALVMGGGLFCLVAVYLLVPMRR